MPIKKIKKSSPARMVVSSIIGTIALGSFLLWLPFCHLGPLSYIDALFTATSATTVTGLLTIDITQFTFFGQCILLLLMQIGGLGLITMTLFAVSLFAELGLGTQLMFGKLFDLDSSKNIQQLLFFIIGLTLSIELLGMIGCFLIIHNHFALLPALFYSLFHAISSFCNAGFTIFPSGISFFQQSPFLLLLTSGLIILGGLGFITLHELCKVMRLRKEKKHIALSLNSRLILYITPLLLASSSIIYFILERNESLKDLSIPMAAINAFFNATSMRSAGFSSMPIGALQAVTLFLIAIFAYIGAAPGSTGSGIKITTFAVFIHTIKSAMYGLPSVDIQGRQIPHEQAYKALSIVVLGISWIILVTFFLLITETDWPFFDIFFEVISAFSTLGISTGITPHLSITGKSIIMATMLVGRVGALTMIIALRLKKQSDSRHFSYPEERVMLG